MNENYNTTEFKDELLADKTVCRRYSNGRVEWRTKVADFTVEWRDNQNQKGVDELLGNEIIKRTVAGRQIIYGREQGYGRTLWSDNNLTVNRTSFPGRIGGALTAVGGAMLLGGLIAPPMILAQEQEAELRRQRAAQQQSSGDSGSGGSSSETESAGGSDWDESGDAGSDGDFG